MLTTVGVSSEAAKEDNIDTNQKINLNEILVL